MAVSQVPGQCVMTAGVAAFEPKVQAGVFQHIRNLKDFEPANDPHGEHDFGAISASGQQLFWKIDCYSDAEMEYGAEDPVDHLRRRLAAEETETKMETPNTLNTFPGVLRCRWWAQG
jgi:Protein of unknown function (DUF3768)